VKCESCRQVIWKKDIEENQNVCPKCGKHFRIDARTRLALLFDDGEYETFSDNLASTDPLHFTDLKAYSDRLKKAQEETGLTDAIINARGKLNGRPVIVSAMEYGFIGGSMGAVVGEVITRAIEAALESKQPIIIISASGGARMMEGVISLMQLAKISAALAKLDEAKVPYISVLTDPTTGGVTASFAMLGDLNIAEPGALIGFAGPRVIEQTIRQKLPPGFQRSEFLLEHGMLDAVVHRKEMKAYIARALEFMTPAVTQQTSA
jgi:acetyl-CoA carboxylase carboxyl transferase subunit beta